MLISSWLTSFRNHLQTRPRRIVRRNRINQAARQTEDLEVRSLLAAPTLVAVRPNVGEFLQEGEVRTTSPNELTLQFNPGQSIDAATIDGNVTVFRAGHDGTFGDGNEVPVSIGYVGLADEPNEVVVRFAENLPDDHYRITIVGAGAGPLQNDLGEAFNSGQNASVNFSLDLGARIIAVDPQPVTRTGNGPLSQAATDVVLYLNEDDLDPASVVDPAMYQLIFTNDTVTNLDDVYHNPTGIVYDDVANSITLTFAGDIDTLSGAGTYRLRVGTAETRPAAPTETNIVGDPGSVFSSANLTLGTFSSTGNTSQVLTSSIDPQFFPFDFPGADDEPGHREIEVENHLNGGPDQNSGVSQIDYNFQDVYGVDPLGNILHNVITENQKIRAREVFEIYSTVLGIDFRETDTSGLTIVTGDLRALDPEIPTGPGGVAGLAGGGIAIMDQAEIWSDIGGGSWFQVAMHEIGHLLGLGHSYELPDQTIQGGNGAATRGAAEPAFPGNHDVVHGQHLHRPDSTDIDMYRFEVPVTGLFTGEILAERRLESSRLDSLMQIFRENPDGTHDLIAQNDDYFSEDSYLELLLEPGVYFAAISASGNDAGIGGTSDGGYDLRVNFRPNITDTSLSLIDTTSTLFDGDGDGEAGGIFNFWFRATAASDTLFVDKAAAIGGDGSLATPFRELDHAFAAVVPGQTVRMVGNAGADGDRTTIADNVPFQIGNDAAGVALEDGSTIDVPKGVMLMIDGGAIIKLKSARVGVGSSTTNIDRSEAALQILGRPEDQVIFTSIQDETIGTDTTITPTTAAPGQWGGISFRNDIDRQEGNFNYQSEGIFLNHVGQADIRYGGGSVIVDSQLQTVNPIDIRSAQPTVSYNTITQSADSAMSADPDSFEELTFHSHRFQAGAPLFTSDYQRIGPNIQWNTLLDNSTNGLFVRVTTNPGEPARKLTVSGRFDDLDIVHYVSQNLEIQGTPGGRVLEQSPPDVTTVTVNGFNSPQGTLSVGTYNYQLVFIDVNGFESPASAFTQDAVVGGATNSILLQTLPPAPMGEGYVGRRLYRSTGGAAGPYTLVAELDGSDTAFLDTGFNLNRTLQAVTARDRARLDARLSIDPGVIVKLEKSRIEVEYGAQLIAEGTSERNVIFTSANDDRYGAGGTFDTNDDDVDMTAEAVPAPGDWGGIYVGHVGSGSIDNALLAFGGGIVPNEGDFNAFNVIEVHQADFRISNSTLDSNANGRGGSGPGNRAGLFSNGPGTIFVRGAQPVIINNDFRDNASAAITVNANSLGKDFVSDSGRSTGFADRLNENLNNQGPLVRGNRFGNNAMNGMIVRGETLTTQGVWDDTDIAHIVLNEIYVPDFHTYGGLRLESSSTESLVVKLQGANAGISASGYPLDIVDRIGGSLQIIGQPGKPVVLTSLSDDAFGAGFDLQGFPMTDTNNDGISAGTPGDWRSVSIEEYAHDRNVKVHVESEIASANAADSNSLVSLAENLGLLASGEKSGDENLRLGFEVHGIIDSEADADVYSFTGTAGTQVWLDLDRTDVTLDSILELLDANGNTIAISDNINDAVGLNPSAAPTHTLAYSQFQSDDLYTLNELDAGMRVALPGAAGTVQTYFVRVRSSNSSPLTNLVGESTGHYQLQVRLRELDEVPGSQITYASIGFATNGVEIIGQPSHSPLLGESTEINNAAGVTQVSVGNLLNSDRAALSLAGRLSTDVDSSGDIIYDVDFWEFEVNYDATQQISGVALEGPHVPVTIDLDFADGFSRADATVALFNSDNELVLIGRDSNISDDQPLPLSGASVDDLSRGSAGKLDPFIGPVELPGGTYRLAVFPTTQTPQVLNHYFTANPTSTLIRLEPVNSTVRVAEEGFDQSTSLSLPFVSPASNRLGIPVTALDSAEDVAINSADLFNLILGAGSATAVGDTVVFSDSHISASLGSTGIQGALTVQLADGATILGDSLSVSYSTDTNKTARRPIEDLFHVDSGGDIDPKHVVPFNLGDVTLFVSSDNGTKAGDFASVVTVDPFTGAQETVLGGFNRGIGDVAMRADGQLHSLSLYPGVPTSNPNNLTDAGVGNYLRIDTGTAAVTNVGDDGISTNILNGTSAGAHNVGVQFFAMTYSGTDNGNDLADLWAIGGRSTLGLKNGQQGFVAAQYSDNILYNLNLASGAIDGNGGNRQNTSVAVSGAGTTQVEHGFVDTTFTNGGLGGTVTGMVTLDGGISFLVVDDSGGLYSVSRGGFTGLTTTFIRNIGADATTGLGGLNLNFEGLTLGPENVEDGRYAQTLFGITSNGDVHAFDTTGELLPIFADAQTSISTGVSGVNGLAFGTLDYNLWHVTTNRGSLSSADDGHGIDVAPFDDSLLPESGGASLAFTFEHGANTPDPSLDRSASGNKNTNLGNNQIQNGLNRTLDFPGGAHGSVVSNEFSLEDYDSADKPTLYFSYWLDTEDQAYIPPGATDDPMRDAFRVFVSDESGEWNLLVTNNSHQNSLQEDEYDLGPDGSLTQQPVTQTFPDVVEAFDTDNWRQARIDLSNYAGRAGLQLRFDFSTAGGMDVGNIQTDGYELYAVDATEIEDGDSFSIFQTPSGPFETFEFDLGGHMIVPTGNALDGETFTVLGNTFRYSTAPSQPTDIAITLQDSATTVAEKTTAFLNGFLGGTQIELPDGTNIEGESVTVGGMTFTFTANPIVETDILAEPLDSGATLATRAAAVINARLGAGSAFANNNAVDLPGATGVTFGGSMILPAAASLEGTVFTALGTTFTYTNTPLAPTDIQIAATPTATAANAVTVINTEIGAGTAFSNADRISFPNLPSIADSIVLGGTLFLSDVLTAETFEFESFTAFGVTYTFTTSPAQANDIQADVGDTAADLALRVVAAINGNEGAGTAFVDTVNAPNRVTIPVLPVADSLLLGGTLVISNVAALEGYEFQVRGTTFRFTSNPQVAGEILTRPGDSLALIATRTATVINQNLGGGTAVASGDRVRVRDLPAATDGFFLGGQLSFAGSNAANLLGEFFTVFGTTFTFSTTPGTQNINPTGLNAAQIANQTAITVNNALGIIRATANGVVVDFAGAIDQTSGGTFDINGPNAAALNGDILTIDGISFGFQAAAGGFFTIQTDANMLTVATRAVTAINNVFGFGTAFNIDTKIYVQAGTIVLTTDSNADNSLSIDGDGVSPSTTYTLTSNPAGRPIESDTNDSPMDVDALGHILEIDLPDTPIVIPVGGFQIAWNNQNRVTIPSASAAPGDPTGFTTSPGSPLEVSGAADSAGGNNRIAITPDMDKLEVATAIRQALANVYAPMDIGFGVSVGDITNIKGHEEMVRIISAENRLVFNNSKLGLVSSLPGDTFGAFSDGFVNGQALRPGSLRGMNNNIEGVYIDDIIIGFAERGEMVTNAPSNANFIDNNDVLNPNVPVGNNFLGIVEGAYDVEIRRAYDYGQTQDASPTNSLYRAIDTNDREARSVSIDVPSADQIPDRATITVSDNIREVTLQFVDMAADSSADPGNVPISFDSRDATNGTFNDGREAITAALIAAFNSQAVQDNLAIQAAASDTVGSTATRIHLSGNAIITPDASLASLIPVTVFDGDFGLTLQGDQNNVREQGQIIVQNSFVTDSSNFGIVIDAAVRGGLNPTPHAGSVRNTQEINTRREVTGVVIQNNVIALNINGGVQLSGDTNNAPQGSVQFARIVNNTIVGPNSGTGILVEQNMAPTILNNIVVDSTTGIFADASSVGGTVLSSNLYQNNGSNSNIGGGGNFAINLTPADVLFVDKALRNYYPAPGSQAIDSSIKSLADRTDAIRVKSPLGIGRSPIVAPELDVFGQLRGDDPDVATPEAQGGSVFNDRGAIDRIDFAEPVGQLFVPLDASAEDDDPDVNEVLLSSPEQTAAITLRLNDQGIGIDDTFDLTALRRNVYSQQFELYIRDNTQPNGLRLLQENVDYIFQYNIFTKEVTFLHVTAFPNDRVYEIWVKNNAADPADTADFDGVRDLAGNFIAANRNDGSTKFYVALSNGINDAPVNTVPGPQTIAEDNTLTFDVAGGNAVSVFDDDIALGSNELTVTLVASHGTVTATAVTGVAVTTSGPAVTGANQISVSPAASMIGESVAVGDTYFTFVDSSVVLTPLPTEVPLIPGSSATVVASSFAAVLNHSKNFGTGTAFSGLNTVTLGNGVTASTPSSPTITLGGATITTDTGAASVGGHVVVAGTVFTYVDVATVAMPTAEEIAIDVSDTAAVVAVKTAAVLNTYFGAGTNVSGNVLTLAGLDVEDSFVTLHGDVRLVNQALEGLQFVPDPHYYGPASLAVLTEDNGEFTFDNRINARDFDVVAITVTSANDNPTLDVIADQSILEDTATLQVNMTGLTAGPLANTPPNETESIRVTATSSNTSIIPDPTISYSFFDTQGDLEFAPVPNMFGVVTITVVVEDAGLDNIFDDDVATTGVDESADNLTFSRTFTITVNAVNDAPTLDPIADTSIDEDTGPGSVGLTGISPGPGGESENVRFTASSSDTNIIVNPTVTYTNPDSTGTLAYDLVADAYGGPVTITVTAEDAGLDNIFDDDPATAGVDESADNLSTVQTFDVVVDPVNDLPTITSVPDQTHPEDGGQGFVSLTGISNGAANETESVIIAATSSNTTLIPDPQVLYLYPSPSGTLIFEPLPDAFGTATITLTLTDGGLDGILVDDPATTAVDESADNGITLETFDVTITEVNDLPEIDTIATQTINEDSGPGTVNLTGINNGAANEDDAIRVTATSSNTLIVANPMVTYTSASTTGTLTYDLVADAYGSAIVTVTVEDAGVDNMLGTADDGEITTTFTVNVNPVNDAPLIDGIANVLIDEDTGPGTVALTGIDNGPANETEDVRISATSSDPSIVANPSITYNSLDPTGTLTYNLIQDQFGGPVTITVTVEDAGIDGVFDDDPATGLVDESLDNLTAVETFEITVNPVNDPPTLLAIPDESIDEDGGPTTVALTGITNGPANETETVVITATSSNTNLIPQPSVSYNFADTTGELTYDMVADQFGGPVTITVTATDAGLDGIIGNGDDGITQQTFDVTVNPVNDLPTINAVSTQTVNEDSVPPTVALSGITSGAANEIQDLVVTAVSSDTTIVANPVVTYSSADTTASLDYTLVSDAFGGPVTITVTVTDSGLDGIAGNADDGSTDTTFLVNVLPVNDAPTIDPIADQAIDEDSGVHDITMTGITNGPSNELEQISVSAVSSNPSLIPNPTVAYNSGSATGVLSYAPTSNNFGGPVTITVTVTDAGLDDIPGNGDDASTTTTFEVTVAPVNDVPTLNPIPLSASTEDGSVQTVNLTGITAGQPNEVEGLRVTATVDDGSVLIVPGGGAAAGQVITVNGVDFTYVTASTGANTEIVIIDVVTLVTVDSTAEVAEATAETLNAYFGIGTAMASGNTVSTALPMSTSSAALQVVPFSSIIATPVISYSSPDTTGQLTYNSLPNMFGAVTVTVTVTDNGLDDVAGNADDAVTTEKLTIIVNAVNDSPSLNSIDDLYLSVSESQQIVNLTGISNGPVNELEDIRFTITSSNTDLIPTPSLTYTGGPSGTLTLDPVAGVAGASIITIVIEDAGVDGVFDDPLTPENEAADNRVVIQTFRVSTPPIITSPAGEVTDNTPLITFTEIPDVTYYEIRLENVTEDTFVYGAGNLVRTSSNSYQIPGVLPLGEYRIDVRAIDALGVTGPWSDVISFTVAPPPIVLTPTTDRLPDSTPTFSWTSIPGAETYNLEIFNAGTTTTVFSAIGLTQTSLNVGSSLLLGAYEYTITAVNTPVISTEATITSSVTGNLVISTPPEVLDPAVAIYNRRPTITWREDVPAVVSDIEVFNVTTNQIQFVQTNVIGTSYTLSNSQTLPDGEYRIRVRSYADAFKTVGSDYSNIHVFQVGSPPVLLGPADDSFRTTDRRPELTFQGSLTGESYRVWLTNRDEGMRVVLPNDIVESEGFRPSQDLPIGSYSYWVQAISGEETSPWSQRYDFQVVTPPTIKPSARSTFDPRPTIEWEALDGADEYLVWINKVDVVPAVIHEVTTVSGTSYQPSADLANGKYKIWVRGVAKSDLANVPDTISNYSTPFEFAIGGRPIVTSATATSDATPTFTWEAVGLASSYEVFISNAAAPGVAIIRQTGISSTSFTPSDDLADGNYMFWVRAYGPTGQVTAWSLNSSSKITVSPLVPPTLNEITSTANPTPTFSWTAVQGAFSYRLFVAPVGATSSPVIDVVVSNSSFQAQTPLPAGEYRAWVRTITANSQLSSWSAPITFTIAEADGPIQPVDDVSQFMFTSIPTVFSNQLSASDVTVSQIPAVVVEDSGRAVERTNQQTVADQVQPFVAEQSAAEPDAIENSDDVMQDWDAAIWEEESAVEVAVEKKAVRVSWAASLAALTPAILRRRRKKE